MYNIDIYLLVEREREINESINPLTNRTKYIWYDDEKREVGSKRAADMLQPLLNIVTPDSIHELILNKIA